MKKSKKVLTLNNLVISKLTYLHRFTGGSGGCESIPECQASDVIPLCPRPQTIDEPNCKPNKTKEINCNQFETRLEC